MIDKDIERRVAELERRLPAVAGAQLDEKIDRFFDKYGVIPVGTFFEALANKDRLDELDSDYFRELKEKGGFADLKEIFRLGDELYPEGPAAPAGPDKPKPGF
jgi:hypothetical protein